MNPRPTRTWRLGAVLLVLQATGAAAAAAAAQDPQRPRLETIVVTAHPLSAEGLALASEVLEGQELSRKLQSSIGATVGFEPGVQLKSPVTITGLNPAILTICSTRIFALFILASSPT